MRKNICCLITFFVLILFPLLTVKLTLAQSAQNISSQDSTKQLPFAKDILTNKTPEAKVLILRKHQFIQDVASSYSAISNDTSLVFNLKMKSYSSLLLSPEDLQEVTPVGADPLGKEFNRRYNDIPPTLPLTQFIKNLIAENKSSRKKKSLTEMPIPSDLEIEILKVLWIKPVVSSSEIYAQLDAKWPIASEDLNIILEQMSERGFLDRKKISPSHKLGLFGIAQIELSSKNRKNKLYIYWPLVAKEELITYLDSRRYLAFSAARENSQNSDSSQFHKMLEDRLNRIVR